jgi:hypothetical protein
MLSPKAKRNLSRIIPFGIIWLLSGLVFLVVERAARGDFTGQPSTGIEMNWQIFIFSSLAITIVGLLVGLIEVVYLNNVFFQKELNPENPVQVPDLCSGDAFDYPHHLSPRSRTGREYLCFFPKGLE